MEKLVPLRAFFKSYSNLVLKLMRNISFPISSEGRPVPSLRISFLMISILLLTYIWIPGRSFFILYSKSSLSLHDKFWVPKRPWSIEEYGTWVLKYSSSLMMHWPIVTLFAISFEDLHFTPNHPCFNSRSWFWRFFWMTSLASSSSHMSILVKTPMVLSPSGSIPLWIAMASELLRSLLAGETARMTVLLSEIWFSVMALSWASTFISTPSLFFRSFVMPGKSINERSGQVFE